jgi:hypothetical protein
MLTQRSPAEDRTRPGEWVGLGRDGGRGEVGGGSWWQGVAASVESPTRAIGLNRHP